MKIISGKLKGRNIDGYNIEGTRPTMDRVKMGWHDLLQICYELGYVFIVIFRHCRAFNSGICFFN